MNRQIDSYSGFYDNGHLQSTGLGEYLQDIGASAVYVMGLATDYCVRFTALDSIGLGFPTFLILDGCRGVNLHPGDVDRSVEEMRKAEWSFGKARIVLWILRSERCYNRVSVPPLQLPP